MSRFTKLWLPVMLLLVLANCASAPTPVWQDMNYRMNNGKVGLMGPSSDIGP